VRQSPGLRRKYLETVFTKHAFNSYFFSVSTPIFLHQHHQSLDTEELKHRKNRHFLQIQSAFVTRYHKIIQNGTSNLCEAKSTGALKEILKTLSSHSRINYDSAQSDERTRSN
jgi:hypothetical protein